ncbi:MAG: thioredoxin family protein [Candidatus Norongarragalinales archaeon]
MQTKTLVLIIIAVAALGGALFFFASAGAGVKGYVDENSPVMYFYSAQCTHCQAQAPILEELSKEGYRVRLMDVLVNPEYWKQYDVSGTPTFLAANGDRQVGFTQKEALRAWLEAHGARIAQQN